MSNNPTDASEPSSISSTLLERVRARRPEAWERLVDLYGPVVYRWCRQAALRPEDAADLVQEVFAAVAAHVAEFRRDRPGDSFGAWLRTITRNRIRDHYRRRQGKPEARGGTDAQQQLAQIGEPPEPSDPSAACDDGLDAWLSRRGLELVRAEFENRTWEAFWRTTVEGHAPAHVAEDLGMSVQAVYKAKSRVLRRLRQELGELI
jgi:RNA polymerase sigma-70 factor (ECF subfamily)